MNNPLRIRTCVVWKIPNLLGTDILARSFWNKIPWRWYCRKCPASGAKPSWNLAYQAATRHAHNHHRSKP